jgi:hypothetical protein
MRTELSRLAWQFIGQQQNHPVSSTLAQEVEQVRKPLENHIGITRSLGSECKALLFNLFFKKNRIL